MKAMEPGAPMISVPAGVLKEFMSPTNSRTPTPPLSAAVTVSNITNKNFLPTLSSASNSNSRTSSPILPSSIDISAVTVNSVASVSTPELSTSVALTNGQVSKDDSVSDSENEENKKSKTFDKKEEAPEKRSIPEVLVNGVTSGVKRTSEDEGGSEKPDLKKIRVFKPTPEDVHKRLLQNLDQHISDPYKQRTKSTNQISPPKFGFLKNKSGFRAGYSEVRVDGSSRKTIKEFNQHLDQVSKKYGDSDIQENKDLATINELRSCYNNVPAGAGVVSGVCSGDGNSSVVGQANVATRALVNSGQSKDVEVLTATPKMREVLTPISKEREIINSNMRERVTTVVDKENKQIKRRLQRLPRKELENMIMRQFSEKTLYQCELGKMKQLCEKLETTLESNRKKTAQFHKEIEDLRKVTNRLSAEHLSRKGQYVAPIRIKRSVGIQAAPHIINKGIMHASGSGGLIKTIAPRPSSLVGVSSSSSPVKPYHLVASEVCSPPNVTFQTKMIPTSSTQQSLITQGTVGILAQSQPSIGRPQAMNNMGGTTGLPTMATSAPGLSTIRPTAGQMLMMTAAGAMQALPRATNAGVITMARAQENITPAPATPPASDPGEEEVASLQNSVLVLERLQNGESATNIRRECDVNKSSVGECKKTQAYQSLLCNNETKYNGNGKFKHIEPALTFWIENQMQNHVPVSDAMIQKKAWQIYEHMSCEGGPSEEPQFNHAWLEGFKKFHQFHNISLTSEFGSADKGAVEEFLPKLLENIEKGGYSPDQVFNANETELYWKRLPDSTFVTKDKTFVSGLETAQDYLSLLLCANASGDLKMKPMMVYHSKEPHSLKGTSLSQLPVLWKWNKTPRVTAELFEDWFVNYAIPTVQNYCQCKNLAEKALILVDHAQNHPLYLNDIHDTIKIMYLPRNTTSLIQPLSQGIFTQLKCMYLKSVLQNLLLETEGKEANDVKEFWKSYTIKDCIMCISKCWCSISQETLNCVWYSMWPAVVSDFKGFPDSSTEVQRIVEIACKIPGDGFSDITIEDINKLLESHKETFSVDELIKVCARAKHKECATVSTKSANIAEGKKEQLGVFLEELLKAQQCLKIDPDLERSANVSSFIEQGISIFTEAYVKCHKSGPS
nr:uncharacterized protein LOC123770459 isoform X1 [Procambarus clarkii]XP_045618268.1 uncharacterized protein LOC123770459 isoform X1 [Procambarus clarkii]XP_045618269.1 uncharacterized protein LOC123770459 isoform X1 [Procambarus clarkii]XP_045618270.1 uncharacterized protein LOC123770459 isoform X1 [Procambarus clarkii]XP_045618271.1 uncharacterized protein LOC123770459 isoform X1 [Procambarus clarkii]